MAILPCQLIYLSTSPMCPFLCYNAYMTKEKLIETIQRLLKTDIDLGFLLQLKKTELETLLACIRHEVGR